MVIEKLTFSTSVSFTAAQRICYNLFQTYSENVCIDASLVMDQLEDVISHKKLTKRNSTNFQQDQDQNNFDTLSTTTTKDDCTSNDFMGSFSSLPAPDLFRDDLGHPNDQGLQKAWSSIQSLENRLCPKSNDVPINDAAKVTDTDSDKVQAGIGIEGLGFKPKSQESDDKPELSEVQKAFWSRKNKFMLPFMRRILRKKRMRNESENDQRNSTNPYKFGAVVNLATMAAGMSSLPIVYSMNISDSSENETKEDDIAEEDKLVENEAKKTDLEEVSPPLLDFEDDEDEIIKKFEHDMKGLAQLKRKKSPNILMKDETIQINDGETDNPDHIDATENVNAFAELLEQKLKEVAKEETVEEFDEKSEKAKRSVVRHRSRSRMKENPYADQGYDAKSSKKKVELVVNDQIVVLNSNKETWL